MNSPLTVYLDFKSPYSYLAVEPTRDLAKELGIDINWLPVVLDIPSYLGSAKLSKTGEVAASSRSDDQWSWVKYAYYDCRRYANLRGLTIRGTVKIWDTNLAAIGMLWAKEQGEEILQQYIDGIYRPFWKRELDVENPEVIAEVLSASGATVEGFADYVSGEGKSLNSELQEDIFNQGVFGVPSYVLDDEVYFGRQHLPRLRWLLGGKRGPEPDMAYELRQGDSIPAATSKNLSIGLGLEDPESYQAIESIQAMLDGLDVEANWYALPGKKKSTLPDISDQSRGARHRRFRSDNRESDRRRYIPDYGNEESLSEKLLERLRALDIALDSDGRDTPLRGAEYVGSPVFGIGDEIFVGRFHLPLIRAMLERAGV